MIMTATSEDDKKPTTPSAQMNDNKLAEQKLSQYQILEDIAYLAESLVKSESKKEFDSMLELLKMALTQWKQFKIKNRCP